MKNHMVACSWRCVQMPQTVPVHTLSQKLWMFLDGHGVDLSLKDGYSSKGFLLDERWSFSMRR